MSRVTRLHQPVYIDKHGTKRLHRNKVVDFLYEFAKSRGMGLNELGMMEFPRADREQFYQMLGYSVCGYSEIENGDEERWRKRLPWIRAVEDAAVKVDKDPSQ